MFVENVQLTMPFSWGFKTKIEWEYNISVHYQCSWTLISIGRLHHSDIKWRFLLAWEGGLGFAGWCQQLNSLFSVGLFPSKPFYWTNLLSTYLKANHYVTTSSKPLCLNDTYPTHVISGPALKRRNSVLTKLIIYWKVFILCIILYLK